MTRDLGRAIHQVEIRGFRTEPDEIEAALYAMLGRSGVILPGSRA